ELTNGFSSSGLPAEFQALVSGVVGDLVNTVTGNLSFTGYVIFGFGIVFLGVGLFQRRSNQNRVTTVGLSKKRKHRK
ncbi:MAG: hypothetical protein GOV15_02080, partial [Candidatus Diapherotrites archaeon]|nr:hypothetical protein [Candidatus Diapherotrites archaeon]